MKFFKLNPTKLRRGDTIVEVMVSLLVLSMVITSIYAIMNTSLKSGNEANQRTEALALAQSQVDLLVNAKNTDPNFATNYQVATPFCLNADGTKNTSANSAPDKLCDQYNSSNYNVGVSYSGGVYTITAQWPAANAPNGVANLNLYYKLPGVYKKSLETTGSAVVNGTRVQLNGFINSNGNTYTSCYFAYDTHSDFSSPTNAPNCLNSGCADSPPPNSATVCTNLSGLTPGQQYYFQLCATNIVGSSCSASSGTFTVPNTPLISGEQATNTSTITGTTATLNGSVNPGGADVDSCTFQWGTTSNYGNSQNCTSLPGSGTSPVPESVNIVGLVPGTLYHFRLAAHNASGDGVGADVTFTPTMPPPTLTFTADSTNLSYGGSTTLRWSSNYAAACTASGGWSGVKAVNGAASTGSLTSNTTYSLYCSGSGGNSPTRSVTITVSAPPPSLSFYADSTSLSNGSSTTLHWSSSGATSCNASGQWGGGKGPSGSEGTGTLYGSASYGYYLQCFGPGGSTSIQSVVINVAAPPPPPPSCNVGARAWRSGSLVWISAEAGGCDYYLDSVVGWNGGGTWGPFNNPSWSCHTQQGGKSGWGWVSSSTACWR